MFLVPPRLAVGRIASCYLEEVVMDNFNFE